MKKSACLVDPTGLMVWELQKVRLLRMMLSVSTPQVNHNSRMFLKNLG
jgi:hypothetical protein